MEHSERSDKQCTPLLESITLEMVCQVASQMDFDSLIKFLSTCKLLRGLRDDPVLTTALSPFHALRLEARGIRINKITVTERGLVNRARLSQYKELNNRRAAQYPILVVKDSIVHHGMLQRGRYCSKSEIRTLHEVIATTSDSDADICHALDSLFPMETCDTLVDVNATLLPARDHGLEEPIKLMEGKVGIGKVFGSHHLLEQVTYSLIQGSRSDDSPMFQINTAEHTSELSIHLPVTLVLISSDPISPELERLAAKVNKKIAEISWFPEDTAT